MSAHLSAEEARRLAEAALAAHGVPHSDCETVADCLVEADLQGVPTHGVARLPFYLGRIRRGLIETRPKRRTVIDRPSSGLIDAGNGLGPIAGREAMETATLKARETGVGACGVQHSNHLGMLGWYVERPAREGFVALAFSNAPASMAPPGSAMPLLGTNPIAAGFPTGGDPVVIDLATSQVARSRISRAANLGEPIPEGWGLDRQGRPTTDARAALDGSVVPLGGVKGFALALIVEALTGVLTGAGVGREVTGTVSESEHLSNTGHLFLALDSRGFEERAAQRMEALADLIRAAEPAAVGAAPHVPGDRRRAERARRLEAGLDYEEVLLRDLERPAEG